MAAAVGSIAAGIVGATIGNTTLEESREWHNETIGKHEENIQAMATAYERDFLWRTQDVDWREKERAHMRTSESRMDEQARHNHLEQGMWRRDAEQQRHELRLRQEDVNYREVQNGRRQLDLKIEQLRTTSNLSALVAGFQMVAFVELNIPEGTDPTLLMFFSATAAAVVAMNVIAMILSSQCVMALTEVQWEKNWERGDIAYRIWDYSAESDEVEREHDGRSNETTKSRGHDDVAKKHHRHTAKDWHSSVRCFYRSMPLFLLNLVFVGHIKYGGDGVIGQVTPWVTTAVIGVFSTFMLGKSQYLGMVRYLTTEGEAGGTAAVPPSPHIAGSGGDGEEASPSSCCCDGGGELGASAGDGIGTPGRP